MSLRSNLAPHQVTLEAGAEKELNITGQFLRVWESDAEFYLRIEDQGWCVVGVGFQYATQPGEMFRRVSVRNPQSYSITFDLRYGVGNLDDNRLNVVTTRPNQFVAFADAATYIATTDARTSGATAYLTAGNPSGGVANQIAAAGYVLLSGNRWQPGSTTKMSGRRRFALISNNDPLSILEVRITTPTAWATSLVATSNGNLVAIVQPKTTLPIFCDDDLAVVNGTGSDIACCVSETFYVY